MAVPGETACTAVGAVGDPPSCPGGQLAIPGDEACHALADCGTGTWGAIPVDAATQYVDASYAGGGSDGSAARPWTTIGAAVGAAPSGGIVAIAAGSYREDVVISNTAVRLWGRCPAMTEIVASGGASGAAVEAGRAAPGTEIHWIALTGDGIGASVGAGGVVVDAAWVHDTTQFGVDAAGRLTMNGSLVERCGAAGIRVTKGEATADASVVRDTAPAPDGSEGVGIEARTGGSVSIRHSVLERNHDTQLGLDGADGVLDGCVVRDGLPKQSDMSNGVAVFADFDGHRPSVTVRASTLERNATVGIVVVGADLLVERSLIRDMKSRASDGTVGYAIDAYLYPDSPASQLPSVTVRASLVERARTLAIAQGSGTLSIVGSVVRDTLTQESDGLGGYAVQMTDDTTTHDGGTLSIRGSVIERYPLAGIEVGGARATVESTVVGGASAGGTGHGAEVTSDGPSRGSLTLTGCVVRDNYAIGLADLSGDLSLDRTTVSSTHPASALPGGYAIEVDLDPSQPSLARPTLAVQSSLLTDSVGVVTWVRGADVTLSNTCMRGSAPRPTDGALGDGLAAFGDAQVTASSVRIEQAARAGLSMFDAAQVTLSDATLACDTIPLDGEDQSAFTAGGPLACECDGAATTCQVLSSNLQPPAPIAPSK
jgi:hypothetical protein